MRKLLMILLGVAWLGSQSLRAQEVSSFKDWKSQKIQEVLAEIKQLENLEKSSPSRYGPEEQAKLKQARTNLEINQELNAQDYFVLYLSPRFQNDEQAYTKAVQMMAPEEIAQILLAYDKLIEEKKRKSLSPMEHGKYGLSTPRKLDPSAIISAIEK